MIRRSLLVLALLPLLGGCGALQRLSEVGRPPEMTPSSDPTKDPNWRPVSLPMPASQVAAPQANTLWRSGSRAFFKDQRAAQVGDIVTVLVNIADSANIQDNTTITRVGAENMGMKNMFGLETQIPKWFSGANPASLVATNSDNGNTGKAQANRTETMTLRLAAVITQVLPNGNLAVSARQEVRVNRELRELQVTGVIRPQDIASNNTVNHDRLAEARIAYGGRGQLTEVQSARWGQQVLDILLPF